MLTSVLFNLYIFGWLSLFETLKINQIKPIVNGSKAGNFLVLQHHSLLVTEGIIFIQPPPPNTAILPNVGFIESLFHIK